MKDGASSKYTPKKAAERYLPYELIRREKMGFAVPLDRWLRGELKEMVYDMLLSHWARQRGSFWDTYARNLLELRQRGVTAQYTLWNLLMLEL